MTKRAPGALRYIDPSWDKASPDGRLYPFYWYWFEDNRGDTTTSQENAADDDEVPIEDLIWAFALNV